MVDPKDKNWIDNATLEDLLRRWRFASVGDPIFQGETGEYYSDVMFKKKGNDPDKWVAASKKIGWGKNA